MDPMRELAGLWPLLAPWATALGYAAARVGGLMLSLPLGSSAAVPKTVRAVVVLALALGLSTPHATSTAPPPGVLVLITTLVTELVYGLALGFVVRLALDAIRIAGEIAGIEMGLSFAAVADPSSQGQSTAGSTLFAQLGIQLFFALNLDHTLVRGLARGLGPHPLGEPGMTADLAQAIVAHGEVIFDTALALALPIMAALLSLKIGMAMLARVAPKLQIFTLAFALSSAVGLVILQLAIPSIGVAAAAWLEEQTSWAIELMMS
jgi:flagellar biosynthetic protein FliR